MRLYYFPPVRKRVHTVITYPVGLGRDEWHTLTGGPDWNSRSIEVGQRHTCGRQFHQWIH